MKENYQLWLDRKIIEVAKKGEIPTLLLHSCCAPCSSYVLEYLSEYFSITVFYYNPNIYPEEEYVHRVKEQQEFIQKLPVKHEVSFLEGAYDTARFYAMAKGLEDEPERGKRCEKCYELRLREAAEMAKDMGFSYFATTLTISPMKDADVLNEIGARIEKELGVSYLKSDFKKRNGYLRSCELSKEYGMYRQDYCGCVYSQKERQKRKVEE